VMVTTPSWHFPLDVQLFLILGPSDYLAGNLINAYTDEFFSTITTERSHDLAPLNMCFCTVDLSALRIREPRVSQGAINYGRQTTYTAVHRVNTKF
jgi:hypothetical protein